MRCLACIIAPYLSWTTNYNTIPSPRNFVLEVGWISVCCACPCVRKCKETDSTVHSRANSQGTRSKPQISYLKFGHLFERVLGRIGKNFDVQFINLQHFLRSLWWILQNSEFVLYLIPTLLLWFSWEWMFTVDLWISTVIIMIILVKTGCPELKCIAISNLGHGAWIADNSAWFRLNLQNISD